MIAARISIGLILRLLRMIHWICAQAPSIFAKESTPGWMVPANEPVVVVMMPVQVTPGTAWRGSASTARIRNRSACLLVTGGVCSRISLRFVFQPGDLPFKISRLAAAHHFIDRITARSPDKKGDRRRYDGAMIGLCYRHLQYPQSRGA
ncbi:hypothetical protein AJ87_13005 [Rhizobium yanglingense]|nr:hypothetical protein AJ87_13005 [Rhizobium yanglingense]